MWGNIKGKEIMKKIDLHIHTIASVSDHEFVFSEAKLHEYIEKSKLDCIAITNHNLFDFEQYKRIKSIISIPVFPGIEIDLEKGHILLISDINDDLNDFCNRCKLVSAEINTQNDYITMKQFRTFFPNLNKYILIPHYDKNPILQEQFRNELKCFITAGEVSSVKKFFNYQKMQNSLVPVYFSDFRMEESQSIESPCQTYFDIDDEISFSEIKYCLKEKNKVFLNKNKEKDFFEVTKKSLMISSKLNVILGKRSSGKTHLLNMINESLGTTFNKILYIKQFSLLQDDDEQTKFERLLSQNQNSIYDSHLKEFQNIINDVKNIDIDLDERKCAEYIDSLKIFATETERKDVFSKTKLFTETEFIEPNLSLLDTLVKAAESLYESGSYEKIIKKYITKDSLRKMILDLLDNAKNEELKKQTFIWVNTLIRDIRKRLSQKTSSVEIPDVNFSDLYINKKKVEMFNKIVQSLYKDSIIEKRELHGFLIQAKRVKFEGASDIRSSLKISSKMQDAFSEYTNPYGYLQKLKEKEEINSNDFYKYFVKISYEVLNSYGTQISGGERSEFNLLSELESSEKYELLLIDEPESSFDNLFLKNSVDEMIKEISNKIPVVLVTHNNTLGLSIHPDFLLYTEKSIENGIPMYRVYSGTPVNHILKSYIDNKEINTREILLNCLEAGEPSYNDRSQTYEILKN